MKILFVSSEAVPFAKTGGLADVAGALPPALKKLGHDVRVVMPRYGVIDDDKFALQTILPEINVHFQHKSIKTQIQYAQIPGTDVPVYFVKYDPFFDREGLYQQDGEDYDDNAQRFALFCTSALWMLRALEWKPDVIHCNDWQTALIPTYLNFHPDLRSDEFYEDIKTVYTIHNLAYQGKFERDVLNKIGLGWEVYTINGMEFYGEINLMKAGIVFSDEVTTVSEGYAREIQTEEYGCGLEGVLQARSDRLVGIMNGIDYGQWNPETDELIPYNYSSKKIGGKTRCKKALQKHNGLTVDKDVPLIGMISRLADQKGFDLVTQALEDIFDMGAQLVLLGTGDPNYEEIFREIGEKYSGQAGINVTFNNKMAHEIEAGADMFLMPSRYEPCGLNQLYSMKYGTVPIVRKTGGLADSVIDASEKNLKAGKATGFVFEDYKPEALLEAIRRALDLYEKKTAWKALRTNCMKQDYSWKASGKKYQDLYKKMTE